MSRDTLSWLLEPDPDQPGVRYFALRELLDRSDDAPEVRTAQAAVMATGPVPAILDAQYPEGYWVKPGSGYSPKYRSTAWQILWLAKLGANPADERVRRGCAYLLDHAIAENGAFSVYKEPVPRGTVLCLNGNLLWALTQLGWGGEPRVRRAFDWLARVITGEDFDYPRGGTCGPAFACSDNDGLPCAWGAVKAVRALLALPAGRRDASVARALDAGRDFLLSRDPVAADYPTRGKVSAHWFKLCFPLGYRSDVLELATVLARLGCGDDPRLEPALAFVREKRGPDGRWKLERALNGKLWADIEERGRPSKWVTLRALRLLRLLDAEDEETTV